MSAELPAPAVTSRPAARPVQAIAGKIFTNSAPMVVGALVAIVVATVGLTVFDAVKWPAYTSSNVTKALTTALQVVTLGLLGAAFFILRRGWKPQLARLVAAVGLSGFVTVTLGMPLAATKLYLLGVSVDQEFRTEYLTRMTDSAALHDMTYAGLPPFYPAGWFWIGGRFANLAGMPGWEAFKPYAIGSIAVAAVVAYVLWDRLIRSDWALLVSAVSTAVVVAYGSPEVYGAVIAILIPPVLVLAWGGFHRPAPAGSASAPPDAPAGSASAPPDAPAGSASAPSDAPAGSASAGPGGLAAIIGTGLFLGVAASFYTLYLGLAAFAVVLLAVLAGFLAYREQGTWRAVLPAARRLLLAAVIAGGVALTVWLPFLLKLLHQRPASSGTAFHYLPLAGSTFPLPMFHFSLLGALCMTGTVWLAIRARDSRRAQALGVGVVAIYLWSLLSMLATAAGTTLLGFRLEVILLMLLSAAGAFGFAEGCRWLYARSRYVASVPIVASVLGGAAAVAFAQDIPTVLHNEISVAYSDTDGNGQRADQRPPDAASYYHQVDDTLRKQLHRPAHDIVVLTSDTNFLAFYPYYGFQGITSHYANPLADFNARNAAIAKWAKSADSAQLLRSLSTAPWRAPDAFIFRSSGDNYTLRLAADVYPNDPNVRRYPVTFPKKLFSDPSFTKTSIGPFVVVTRNHS